MTNVYPFTKPEYATEDQVANLRWMFSPFDPSRDRFTIAKIATTYQIMHFADRGCTLTPKEIHEYLSEIKPMPTTAFKMVSNMMTAC
ncbi:hypothetical protein [Vibrio gangliei]|uniref:hypothetical protein n=1 Tax=Vibrio gangliei TaxID=2077090 RepID=UPI0013007CAB|nr:hypothetical protein [Vibrio gangliei]